MINYKIGKITPLEITVARPTAGGESTTELWDLAVNLDGTLFGLVYRERFPGESRSISHMAYEIDLTNDFNVIVSLAELGPRGRWRFDAGTTRPEISASAKDLQAALVALGVLNPPFSITGPSGRAVHADDMFDVIELADNSLELLGLDEDGGPDQSVILADTRETLAIGSLKADA